MPVIAAIIGKPDFTDLTFTINDAVFRYGAFLTDVIQFLAIAVTVFFFVVAAGRRDARPQAPRAGRGGHAGRGAATRSCSLPSHRSGDRVCGCASTPRSSRHCAGGGTGSRPTTATRSGLPGGDPPADRGDRAPPHRSLACARGGAGDGAGHAPAEGYPRASRAARAPRAQALVARGVARRRPRGRARRGPERPAGARGAGGSPRPGSRRRGRPGRDDRRSARRRPVPAPVRPGGLDLRLAVLERAGRRGAARARAGRARRRPHAPRWSASASTPASVTSRTSSSARSARRASKSSTPRSDSARSAPCRSRRRGGGSRSRSSCGASWGAAAAGRSATPRCSSRRSSSTACRGRSTACWRSSRVGSAASGGFPRPLRLRVDLRREEQRQELSQSQVSMMITAASDPHVLL